MPARSSKLGRFFTRPSRPTSSRAARPNPRQRHFEPLEDRRLLALTVITPEWSPQYPNWFYDMGRAVVSRDGTFDTRDLNTDGIADAIQNSRVVWSGTPAPVGTQQKIDDLILFDWFSMGDTPGTADSNPVAGALATAIHDRLAEVDSGVLDLHFIGHGRGAYVNAEVLRLLANDPLAARIGFVQMTTLDPLSDGDDGVLDSNAGGLVDFADNYYQEVLEEGNFHGAAVPGALNFRLNPQMNAWAGRSHADAGFANHQEVHDWYHWTIDSKTVAADEPKLVDAATPVPSAADRALLYDDFVADLNADGTPDDFAGGSRIGYYFSIAGGAIGTVLQSDPHGSSLYTFDIATGTTPLYLGALGNWQQFNNSYFGLAYDPHGDLHYVKSDNQPGDEYFRLRVSFDFANKPVLTSQSLGPISLINPFFGYPLSFRGDGALFGASQRSSTQAGLVQVDRGNGNSTPVFDIPIQRIGAFLGLAFDHAGNAYVSAISLSAPQSTQLVRVDRGLNSSVPLATYEYDEDSSLSVIGGLLYVFQQGKYFTINLATGQRVERGELTPIQTPAGVIDTIGSVASLVTLAEPAWHNRDLRADVNGDGRVTASDVVTVVNTILNKGTRTIDPAELFSFHYDTNNDGRVTTSDLLVVVNHILQAQVDVDPLQQPAVAAPDLPAPANESKRQLPTATVNVNRSSELSDLAFAAALQAAEDEELDPWAVRSI